MSIVSIFCSCCIGNSTQLIYDCINICEKLEYQKVPFHILLRQKGYCQNLKNIVTITSVTVKYLLLTEKFLLNYLK